ncbi:hypothetical protein KIN20_007487 [Parelaphostrongylus tenuis]|uniref:Uncharacterized protein n=1 Tax=Parelaphostrongylus tenuis TaxID=148309 RepID=A0AAD5QHX6_PARTN|nr:hypothetical protein KIN20_007487 [Parelaphostrongylus tenuis]
MAHPLHQRLQSSLSILISSTHNILKANRTSFHLDVTSEVQKKTATCVYAGLVRPYDIYRKPSFPLSSTK